VLLGLPQIHLLVTTWQLVRNVVGNVSEKGRDGSEINRKLIETCLENVWSMIRTYRKLIETCLENVWSMIRT
jgi:hypothetical protein